MNKYLMTVRIRFGASDDIDARALLYELIDRMQLGEWWPPDDIKLQRINSMSKATGLGHKYDGKER